MTTPHPKAADEKLWERFVLPEPPEGDPEDMTSFDHLARNGSVHHLAQHLGNPGTTIVAGERYITRAPGSPSSQRLAPDLLVATGANPEAYRVDNGYIISEQGKPPDFVLEIASRSTGEHDAVGKRAAYASLGIPEYWRFDETGEFHGSFLAGDRLAVDGYEPVPIETVEEGVLQGYSRVLNLLIRWDHGQLGWHDPETGQHIATFEQERVRAETAEEQVGTEREARMAAEERAGAAEARVRELEAELERRRQG